MKIIPLNTVPNQRLRVTLNEQEWELTIKTAHGVMCCDIRCDDEIVVQGMRMLPEQPLIPYRYLTSGRNFTLLTGGDALPGGNSSENTDTGLAGDDD